VGFEKPDPRIFLHALSRAGARAETTLHVGDLYGPDVEGGRSAGLHTALLDPFGDWEGADCPRYPDVRSLAVALAAARPRARRARS
jgi:putative hydrolase of the HAD superfamily